MRDRGPSRWKAELRAQQRGLEKMHVSLEMSLGVIRSVNEKGTGRAKDIPNCYQFSGNMGCENHALLIQPNNIRRCTYGCCKDIMVT